MFRISDRFLQGIPHVKAIQAALGVLLDVCVVPRLICRYPCDVQVSQAAESAISGDDALVDLLELIEQTLEGLDISTRVPLTPRTVKIVFEVMVEVLSALTSVTKELKQGRPGECVLIST